MNIANDLNTEGKEVLQKHAFELFRTQGNSMRATAEWKNEWMTFALVYDTGYYDCYLSFPSLAKSFPFVLLLRYLNADFSFLERELKESGEWNTLQPTRYVHLLDNYYYLLPGFSKEVNEEKYALFEALVKKGN